MDFSFDQTLEQTLQEPNWNSPPINPLHVDISLETSGIQWHQNPNRRAKKKRKTSGHAISESEFETFRELCSGFNGKFSAIAWSDKNIVAFTSIEGISLREDRVVQTSSSSSTIPVVTVSQVLSSNPITSSSSTASSEQSSMNQNTNTTSGSTINTSNTMNSSNTSSNTTNATTTSINPPLTTPPPTSSSSSVPMTTATTTTSSTVTSSTVTSSIIGAPSSGFIHLDHPIFIMDMNQPSQYVTVMTSHSSPIKHLEWLPSNHNGGFNNLMWLLSADLNDKICLWKSDDKSMNHWTCIKTFEGDSIIAVKWLPFSSSVAFSDFISLGDYSSNAEYRSYASYEDKFIHRNQEILVENQTEENKINIPYGMPAFIIVTNTGNIRVCYYRSFGEELWCFLSSKLRIPLLHSSYSNLDISNNINSNNVFNSNIYSNTGAATALITNVDFAILNQKLKLFASLSNGNVICVYDIQLDLFNPCISNSLVQYFQVPLPVSLDIPNSFTGSSLTLESNYVVSHLAACLNQSTLSVFAIISDTEVMETGNFANVGNCRLYKFNSKKKGIEVDPLLQSYVTMGDIVQEVWEYSTYDDICKNENQFTFPTSLTVTGDGRLLIITYLNGSMEVRDSNTLAVVQKANIQQINGNSLDLKKPKIGDYNVTIPISVCNSPNNTLICVLDYSPNIHIIQLPPRDPSLYTRDPFDSHFISDKLERSMLLHTDYWDILAYITTLPSFVKEQILRNIEEEFSTKSSAVQKSHASYIERLKSTMLRVMMSTIGMTSNSHKAFAVSYVDTQIKLNILYILDVFRNSLVNVSACHAINVSVMNFGDFKQFIDSLDQQSSHYQIDSNLFHHLYPMIEWVLFLSSFLWKNISKYASVGSSESPFPMNIPFPITEETKVRSIYNTYLATSGTNILIPGISLLIEQSQEWLAMIQEIIILSAVFFNRYSAFLSSTNVSSGTGVPSSSSPTSTTTSSYSTQSNDLLFFYNFFSSIRKQTNILIERETEMFKARNISQALNELSLAIQSTCSYFNSSSPMLSEDNTHMQLPPPPPPPPILSNSTASISFPHLLLQLDLFPPPLGFLESNHLEQMFPDYSNARIEVDVVSKRKIDKKTGSYKQCSKCHRISIASLNHSLSSGSLHEETNANKPWWFKRYDLCCPICGVAWKLESWEKP